MRVLRSRLFNCAQIAEKAITAIILLRHKTDITKGEETERTNAEREGGRRARYGITATLCFWLLTAGTGMNFNLGGCCSYFGFLGLNLLRAYSCNLLEKSVEQIYLWRNSLVLCNLKAYLK